MICWDCYWGWPKAVADIYDRAAADLDAAGFDPEHELDYGPGHVVWADENWDCAAWCVTQIETPAFADRDPRAMAIVRRSLEELDALPADVRDVTPEDYDGENPENFPPPPHVVMVKR